MNQPLPEPTLTITMPTTLLVVLFLAAMAAWCALHLLLRRRRRWEMILLPAVGFGLGTLTVWLGLLVVMSLRRYIELEGLGGVWFTAAAAAALIEFVILLYRFERQGLPGWAGRLILAMRLAFIVLLLVVLTEPTYTRKVSQPDERIVALLVDDSTSMDQLDPQATNAEKLDLAELLLPGKIPARADPDKIALSLRTLSPRISIDSAWLRQLTPSDSSQPAADPFETRRDQAKTTLRECLATLQAERDKIVRLAAENGMSAAPKDALTRIAAALADSCSKGMTEAQGVIESADLERLRTQAARLATKLDQATATLADSADQLSHLNGAVADAAYQRLAPDVRKSVDDAAAQTRRAVARVVLADRPDKKPALEQQLAGRYTVKVYRFASAATETSLAAWSAPPDATASTPEQLAARQRTDLVAAVQKVQEDVPRKLSGIVVVSDGRHNVKTLLEPAAHALALQNVPVAGVLIGSTAPVVDSCITDCKAPRSVQLTDRVAVQAEISVIGLAGQTVEVALSQGGQVVETKKIPVPSANFQTSVELADVPKKTGLASYQVQIAPVAAERTKENNSRAVHVYVTDDPIRLLLIDGRPRYEYRFLRNLFADRDRSVRLQHVLIHPDRIEGIPQPPTVHASATRGAGEAEANALPAKADDWFQFDAIILGDVSPQELGTENVEILKRYVGERGGRLIVVAGQNHMPQSFASSPLAELLPVDCSPTAASAKAPVEPGYYVRLTPEGQGHTITQLDPKKEDNSLIWESMPEQHLRHPIHVAKDNARTLAFAMPLDEPEFFRRAALLPEEAEQLAKQQEEFRKRNALIVLGQYPAGEVLLLTFDGTWRFRYRAGDTHHHHFWGQVVRWAASDKLPEGNDLVRLGTDRPVYEADEPVVVRARLRDKGHASVATQGASVVVREGKREVLRKRLEPTKGSPGMYTSELGRLPPGKQYQISLAIEDAARPELVAAAGQVSTQIVVTQPQSLEIADLSADRSKLELLAGKKGIVVSPRDCDEVMAVLGPPSGEIVREDRYPLWRSWPILLALLGLATTEWIVRKQGGLT